MNLLVTELDRVDSTQLDRTAAVAASLLLRLFMAEVLSAHLRKHVVRPRTPTGRAEGADVRVVAQPAMCVGRGVWATVAQELRWVRATYGAGRSRPLKPHPSARRTLRTVCPQAAQPLQPPPP